MANLPNWKIAQNKVSEILTKRMATRKDFVFKSFTDTYAAGAKAIMPDQPSDYWMLNDGEFTILEIKTCEQDRFPFKDVRPSQWAGARRIPCAGGHSLFLIAKLPEWQWYRISGAELWDRKENGDKSIGWDEMEKIQLKEEVILA